jgi:non-specific serine/threonine protein kinase
MDQADDPAAGAPPDVPAALVRALATQYAFVSAIGHGGMADVFRAHDMRHGREVAIKVLHARLVAPGDGERFLREVRIVASLAHPNIIPLFDSGQTDGWLWYAMPLLSEGTLAHRLAERGALPIDEAVRIACEVADGLAFAHAHALVHRDVKPHNILLSGGRAMVSDFGLARIVESSAVTRATPSSARLGTPLYMSPEQATDAPHVDGRADQYSLGCVLYEMLTGRTPFDNAQFEALAYQHLNVQPKPVRELRPEIPSHVALGLHRALHKLPEGRFASIGEFAAALREAPAAHADGGAGRGSGNVPAEVGSFVGRENELWECLGLARRARLLTLTGPGGCGKTRFAARLAQRLAPEFPGGLWYAELAGASGSDRAALRVGLAAGVREVEGRALSEALVQAFDRDQPGLLVLDDCDHVLAQVATLVTTLLAGCRHLHVIATSREPLHVPGEQIYVVPPLGVPAAGAREDRRERMAHDAVRLFCERAAAVVPGFHAGPSELDAIAEITRRLDGLPLAIELAAARLRMLALPELLARLNERFRLLADPRREAPERHRTLQGAVEWSHELLDEDERRMLRRLSVFRGGWTLAAATAVCDEQGDDIATLDRLTRLADRSLLVPPDTRGERTRYRLHETIREYAAVRLAEAGETEAIGARHLDYYARLAEMAYERFVSPEQAAWLEQIAREHENVLSALDRCTHSPAEGERGLQLASAMYRHWYTHGLYSLGRRELARALEHPGATVGGPMRARALFSLGGLIELQGDLESSRSTFDLALGIYRGLGDERGVARTSVGLTQVLARMKRFDEAHGYAEASVQAYRRLGDDRGLAYALCHAGAVALHERRPDEARKLLEEAIQLARRLDNPSLQTLVLAHLAVSALHRGDRTEAALSLRASLALVQGLEARDTAPLALSSCAALALDLGDSSMAARLMGASAALHAEQGMPEDDTVDLVQGSVLRARLRSSGLERSKVESLMEEGKHWNFERGVRRALEWLEGRAGEG